MHLRDHFSPPFLSACESKEINPDISRERLQSNFNQKFQISFCEMLKYKLYQLKVLPKRSRLNGYIAGFPPQTQKLTPSLGAKIQIVPIESTAKEVSFEWLHCRISSTDSKVDSITWSVRERVKWSSGLQEKASKPYSLIINVFLREDNILAPTSLLKL